MASPDEADALREGAENLVHHYACVREGENVCVYADTKSEPPVIEAIAAAAREAGGRVVLVIADETPDPEESGLVDPSPIAANAFYAADVILCILSVFKMQWSTKAVAKALKEQGARAAYIGPNTAEELSKPWARFPAEIAFALGRKILEDVKDGGWEVHITDKNGTDLRTRINPDNWSGAGARGPMKKPGAYGVVPASTIGSNRIDNANGRVVLDFLETFGPSADICELTVEAGWITDIKGEGQVRNFREKVFALKNANLLSQISWGLNPKGRLADYLQPPWDKNKMSVITRLAGVIHFGFGATAFHQGGETAVSGSFHTHGVLLKPTVQVGSRTIIEEGRLRAMEDPEILALAGKYGNAKEVLAVPL